MDSAQAHSRSEPSAATLARMADTLAWPMLLLQRDGSLVHANAAARLLLRRGQPLCLGAEQRVSPSEPQQRAGFAAALAAAAEGERSVLHWGSDGQRTDAAVSPLDGAPAANAPLLVMLTVGHGLSIDTGGYAAAHGLSRAEARVLQRLALGEGCTQAAAALGVAVSTVRSQLAAILRKTGLAGNAALMGALARVPPLLAPGEGE